MAHNKTQEKGSTMKKVEIYTTNYCPYCIKAKALLNKESIPFTEINIEQDQVKRSELEKKSHIRTVPQIFVNDEFISDCDGLYKLHKDGKFNTLFK